MAKKDGWHPQKIVFEVRLKGSSLQRLGLEHGFSRVTFNRATKERFPRAHAVIAEFLGVPRQTIWPQFYDDAGEVRSFKQVRAEAVKTARAA